MIKKSLQEYYDNEILYALQFTSDQKLNHNIL